MLSAHEDRQKTHELAAFERFCADATLRIHKGAITQPPPPAPDVSADIAALGRCHFELVRLDPADHLKRFHTMVSSRALLDSALAAQGENFRVMFARSAIHVRFREDSGVRDRRGALRELIDVLLKNGHRGDFRLDGPDDDLPAHIEAIYVAQLDRLQGPKFDTSSAGYVTQLNLDALRRKLERKDYRVDAPLHLLAYIDLGEVSHLSDEQAIPLLIDELLPKSPFQSVWLHEGLGHRVRHFPRRDAA